MVKPDGVQGIYTDKIKGAILEAGFEIVQESTFQLDYERASLFYAEHSGKSFFQSLIAYITR
jgi:nucleoside diphosphate kinase homolog 5